MSSSTLMAWLEPHEDGTVTALYIGGGVLEGPRHGPARSPAARQCHSGGQATAWLESEARAIGVDVTLLTERPRSLVA